MKKSSQNPSFGQGLELASIVIKVINNAVKENNVSSEEIQGLIGKPGKIFKMVNEIFLNYAVPNNEYLELLPVKRKLILEALLGGSRGISDVYGMFEYIDDRFKKLKLDECIQPATERTHLNYYGMKKDANLHQLFYSLSNNLDELCLTQSQIIQFCKEYKLYLSTLNSGHLFLFKEKGCYHVADVKNYILRLSVYLYNFDDAYTYSGKIIITPKLKLSVN